MFKHSTPATWHVLILGIVCGLAFFANLGGIPFYDKGEPREALVVRDIVLNGNWIFPLKLGPADSIEAAPVSLGRCLGFPVMGSNDGSNGSFSVGVLCESWSVSGVLFGEEAL